MERLAPLVLAILTTAISAVSADHILTKRAIPQLKPPAVKLTMRAMMVPAPVPEPLIPPPPPHIFEPGSL